MWRVIPLEMHFFLLSLHLVTQIIKGKQLYYKMWSSKSYVLRIIDTGIFFTAMLITYIFFWRGGLQWRGLHLLFFDRSYQVLLTDVIIPRWATGADPGFQVRGRGGAHLKKLRRAEGGANIFGVFRVKNHDFTPKNLIFPILGGGHAAPPPWFRPWAI